MDDVATTEAPEPATAPEADGAAPDAGPVPLRITEAALAQVLTILAAEDDPDALGLRIEVTGTRGAEYTYDLSFAERDDADPDDRTYHQGELLVIVPANSVDPLWGATLDLPSAEGQGGLVIRNPNRPDLMGVPDVELTGTVRERIEQLLEQAINPMLASHGGFASLADVIESDEGTKAVVTMGGGCQGCAVSAVTLREGIQKAILERIPEVVEVVDATDHDAGENPFYT